MSSNVKINLEREWRNLVRFCNENAAAQESISRLAGVSQSTVSRVLSSMPKTRGGAFKKLCKYAKENQKARSTTDPSANETLMQALKDVWNGTDEHAMALAAIIRAIDDVVHAAKH